ncbi:MAG: hypothetical protein GKR98_13435 [Boseongicola sp.]|nr:MAG: hypothetical protein GKR98_13435 [Boseongicola sp.]
MKPKKTPPKSTGSFTELAQLTNPTANIAKGTTAINQCRPKVRPIKYIATPIAKNTAVANSPKTNSFPLEYPISRASYQHLHPSHNSFSLFAPHFRVRFSAFWFMR